MRKNIVSQVGMLIVSCGLAAGEPEYEVVDITNWTSVQFAALQQFHRFVPLAPAGTPATFMARAQAGDRVVGFMTTSQGHELGVIAYQQAAELIAPLGDYSWQRTWWDGKDVHFENGWVSSMQCLDVNESGLIVGSSTIDGQGEWWYEYQTHAVMRNPGDPTLTDLTPNAHRAAATGANADGYICGWQSPQGGSAIGFRRAPSGQMLTITSATSDVRPIGISPSGRIAGTMTGAAGGSSKTAFACEFAGTMATALPLPATGPSDNSAAYDLNDASMIVGAVWSSNQTYEHFAAVWERSINGTWEGFELNEVLADNPIDALLENAIAVADDGAIIATGRLDGTDLFGSRLYLLTRVDGGPPCPVDLDEDGTADFFDVLEFLDWFDQGDPRADFAADGVFDFFDFVVFLGLFDAGCP